MTADKPLSAFDLKALALLRDHGPLVSNEVGFKLWPDNQFLNAQGAALAGGSLMGRLRKRGLVDTKWRDHLDHKGRRWPEGWVLTPKGKVALRKAEEA